MCASRNHSRPLVAWGRGWPRRLARATLLLRLELRCCGCCAALECAGQEHGRLKIGRGAHCHVHLIMFRETAHEEFRLLGRRDIPGVCEDCLEVVRELLDRRVER
jgi:hypothetical protein